MTNKILRNEVLELLGITRYAYLNLVARKSFEIPYFIERSGNTYSYDRKKILAWIATNPLKHVGGDNEYTGTVNFLVFLFGEDGAKRRVYSYHRLRSMLTKTNVVQMVWDDDLVYN